MEDDQKEQQRRTLLIIIVSIIGILASLYVVGIVTQVYTNYLDWLDHDGFSGQYRIKSVNWNPLYCIGCVASAAGLKTLGLFLIIGGVIFCMETIIQVRLRLMMVDILMIRQRTFP